MAGNSPEDCRKFLASMTAEDDKRYAGEWIAIASGEIVAHGEDPRQVHTDGCKAGKGGPFMHYIYASPEDVPYLCYQPP